MKKVYLQDYYPVFMDLKEIGRMRGGPGSLGKRTKKQNQGLQEEESGKPDANRLVELACNAGLTPFQALVLLVKNAFEGHVFLTQEVLPKQLGEKGTRYFNLRDDYAIDYLNAFSKNLDFYYEGIRIGWDAIVQRYKVKKGIQLREWVLFILCHHLVRLPVSMLDIYSVDGGNDHASAGHKHQRGYYTLAMLLQSYILETEFIRMVNEHYNSRFEKLLMIISSREEVLNQLKVRLMLAKNPEVHDQKDLDQHYFNFILNTKLQHDERRVCSRFRLKTGNTGRQDALPVNLRIKQIHRVISRNCQEIHTDTSSNKSYQFLTELFIESSNLYNVVEDEEVYALIRYFRMTDVLCRLLIFRKKKGMKTYLTDFTGGVDADQMKHLDEDGFLAICKNLEDTLTMEKELNLTTLKIKNSSDDEFALYHEEFLAKKADFLEQAIDELRNQINTCLEDKLAYIAGKQTT